MSEGIWVEPNFQGGMTFQRIAGLILWSVLLSLTWLHRQFIAFPVQWWLDNVVTTAEESTKAAIREMFAASGRVINGFASVVVSLFIDRSFRQSKKGMKRSKRHDAWKKFWDHGSFGTLNAVIEREQQEWAVDNDLDGLSSEEEEEYRYGGGSRAVNGSTRSGSSTVSSSSGRLVGNGEYGRSGMPRGGHGLSRISPRIRQQRSSMKRSGSDLFERPAGFAVMDNVMTERRGLLETTKLWLELSVEVVFALFRGMVSWLFVLPSGDTLTASHSGMYAMIPTSAYIASEKRTQGGLRLMPAVKFDDLNVWTTSDVILQFGYPLEEHVVTTSDGYVLSMQRIPRKDSKEVVFFQHGVLDTSLGWVSNGPQGSQAFAAYDAGADVWLGNCRANPPRAHVDPKQNRSAGYWAYSINELGMEDISALIDRIDAVKRSELLLGAKTVTVHNSTRMHGRSNSDPELYSLGCGDLLEGLDICTEQPVMLNEESLRNALISNSTHSREGAVYSEQGAQQSHSWSPSKPSANGAVSPDRTSFQGQEGKSGVRESPQKKYSNTSIYDRTKALQPSRQKPGQPYKLQVVAHSLGAASVLIYAIASKLIGKDHHISHMILLTPAGFHKTYPTVAMPFLHVLPVVMRFLNAFRPGVGAPAYIPSSLLRYITFKLTVDLQQIPALNELTRAALRLLFNGDSSEWDRALQMPHYSVSSMPALSVHTGAHLIQLIRTGKFDFYDYGSAAVNRKHYGMDTPPSVSNFYPLLQGISIDLVAGVNDGVINSQDVLLGHYVTMKDAGLDVSYKEFQDMGHLDMTFAVKEQLRAYVLSRLGYNS